MKKTVLFALIVLLGAISGIVCWLCRPQYGDGYSERQRELWNERRALFPVFWQYDGRDTQYDGKSSEVYVFLDILRSGGFLPVEKEEFEQTIRRDKWLRKKQLDLRDSEKTPFMFDLTREPDLSSLPADRISSLECLERARGGDADACLAMVTNVSSSKLIFADILTWRQTRDREYWLSRAESLGRPGACFLKQFGKLLQKESVEDALFDSGDMFSSVRMCPGYTSLPGYGEFLNAIDDGDVLLYSVWRNMLRWHDLPDREEAGLRKVLRQRIRSGDIRAMEGMITLQLVWRRNMYGRFLGDLNQSWWMRMLAALPDQISKECRDMLYHVRFLDVDDCREAQNLREALECARVAARRGSKIGMDYWLRFGLLSQNFLTRDDWEDVIRYNRILLEEGYVPYMKSWLHTNTFPELFYCYYPESVLNGYVGRIGEMLEKRGDLSTLAGKLPKESNPVILEQILNERGTMYGSDQVLLLMVEKMSLQMFSPEVLAVYVDWVRELAAEGDPYANLVLGGLYEQGWGVPQDVGKAWSCYVKGSEEIKEEDGYGLAEILFFDALNKGDSLRCRLDVALHASMLSVLLRYPESPVNDPGITAVLVDKLNACSKSKHNYAGLINYCLGYVYENGIGISPDKEKALEYYSRGQGKYPACTERWEKLQKKDTPSKLQSPKDKK